MKPFSIWPDNYHVAFCIQNFPALGTEISQHVCCSLPQVLAFAPICPLGCPDLPVQDNRPNFSRNIFQISSDMLPETVDNFSASHNFSGLPIWQSMGTNPSVVRFYPSCFPLRSHLFLFMRNIVAQHSLHLQFVCACSICVQDDIPSLKHSFCNPLPFNPTNGSRSWRPSFRQLRRQPIEAQCLAIASLHYTSPLLPLCIVSIGTNFLFQDQPRQLLHQTTCDGHGTG